MFNFAITTAATLLALAPAALAAGSARVQNNCGTDVYFASVAQSAHASMQLLPSGGYSESYSKPDVGVSIKLAPSASSAVTQFEFTWANGAIAYDISNIDGNPFASQGMSLTPSMEGASGYPTCKTVSCPAGQQTCSAAYNAPDDVRTMVCPEDSDLIFTLCPGGPVSSPSTEEATPTSDKTTPTETEAPSKTSAAKQETTSAPAEQESSTPTKEAAPAVTTGGWGKHRKLHRRNHSRQFR